MLAGLGYMFDGGGLMKSLGLKLYKYCLSKAERVLVLNQMNYNKIIESKMVAADRLLLLKGGEGVNLNEYVFQPADYSDRVIFLMVSRILYDKGYSEFASAACQLKGKYPNISFEILGPLAYNSPMGVPREVFEEDMQAGIFHYLGVTPNVYSFVSRKNVVLVLPSKYGEGLNRSLMEACAIGRPIITTDIPGCRETVEEGVNGYLVSKGNTRELANAMERFIELPNNIKTEMATHSHRIATEKFDINHVIKIYDELLYCTNNN